MSLPRVTVICLCHNQERFVGDAMASVFRQDYPNIQLLVVDDASADESVSVIRQRLGENPEATFFAHPENLGNCRAFNEALVHAEGEYIIDLAADDVLLPGRVRAGVQALEKAGRKFGVNFCDADWISEAGEHLYRHSDRFPHHTIPQGDIYRDLIERFFICSPTMIFRRSVIDDLQGYDPALSYEDFDFWIRSSRKYAYCYTPEVLVQKRVVRNSMSEKQFSMFDPQLHSTFRVCEKILALNRSMDEREALRRRIFYEMRVALRLFNFPLLLKYARLYRRNERVTYP